MFTQRKSSVQCAIKQNCQNADGCYKSNKSNPLKWTSVQRGTWQVDCLVSQEEAPGDAPAVPGSGEGQDLAQTSHVIFERSRANVTHS